MKVILTTEGGGEGHPYIVQLVTALRAAGATVHFALPGTFTLWRSLRRYGRPDVFHLQWQHRFFLARRFDLIVWRTFWFFIQLLTLRLLGIRVVWTVHEVIHYGAKRAWWELGACRLLGRLVDGIIVHCETAVSLVAAKLHLPQKKFSVAPHGHLADFYPPAPPRPVARETLKWPAEARIFLYFGHIRTYKGLDTLVEVFKSLPKGDDIYLVLAGKPHGTARELVAWLREQAVADPHLLPYFEYIPDDQLVAFLSACDLVVLPYSESLTSAAAILAASYNRPVIASRLGCMCELPADGAILYDATDAEGLREALTTALTAPLDEMGASLKQYIDQFPWSLAAQETMQVYRDENRPSSLPIAPQEHTTS